MDPLASGSGAEPRVLTYPLDLWDLAAAAVLPRCRHGRCGDVPSSPLFADVRGDALIGSAVTTSAHIHQHTQQGC